jgi:hypothetical protein
MPKKPSMTLGFIYTLKKFRKFSPQVFHYSGIDAQRPGRIFHQNGSWPGGPIAGGAEKRNYEKFGGQSIDYRGR